MRKKEFSMDHMDNMDNMDNMGAVMLNSPFCPSGHPGPSNACLGKNEISSGGQ